MKSRGIFKGKVDRLKTLHGRVCEKKWLVKGEVEQLRESRMSFWRSWLDYSNTYRQSMYEVDGIGRGCEAWNETAERIANDDQDKRNGRG
jgi:hypothetical protein